MAGLVTVFGGSGFVGTQVVRALLKRGWRVRVACRKPQRAYDLQPMGHVGQLQLKRADVTNAEQVAAAVAGADAVINLVGILYESPGRSFKAVHVDGARRVAEAAAAAGARALVQMSAIGEESGALDQMLGKAAEFYENEVDEAVKGLQSLLEPIIIVVLGTIIGGIVVSMYLPIFKLGQVV